MIFHKNFVFGHLQKTGGTFVEDFLINNDFIYISGVKKDPISKRQVEVISPKSLL